jgi:hypothetical protein
MRIPSPGLSAAPATALLSMLLVCLVPLAAFGQPSEDGYLAGYVAAVLERQLNVSPRSLKVKDGVVTIDAADVPRADRPRIMTAITAVRGVTRVEIREGAQPSPSAPVATVPAATSAPATESPAVGFLPAGHLFQPLIADPRWPHFSAAYRYYINTPGPKNVSAVSFGETIALYRDNLGDKGQWGQWEAGVQAGVFSIFNLGSDSIDLVNTDFFAAAFVGYRYGDFSAIGRLFHQSSHLGDELLLSDSRPNRINLSYEGLDAKLSYDLPFGARVYGGGGYLIGVDPSDLGRGLAQAGLEWRSPWAFWHERLRPIAGADLQFKEENRWRPDVSLRAGVSFENVSILSRNLQVLAEYYRGRSFDGQFFIDPVEYVGIGVHFNF